MYAAYLHTQLYIRMYTQIYTHAISLKSLFATAAAALDAGGKKESSIAIREKLIN